MQSQSTDFRLPERGSADDTIASLPAQIWTESVFASYFDSSYVPPLVEGWHPSEPLVATQGSGENNSAILVPLKGAAAKSICFQYPAAHLVGLPIT